MKKTFISLTLIVLLTVESFAVPVATRYREFLFGVDYYPEQWSESYWEGDAKRMQESGVNAVRMAEFALKSNCAATKSISEMWAR